MNNNKARIASILSGSLLMLGIPAIAFAQGAPMTQTLIAQQQEGQVTFGNLVAALNNINAQIGELNALNDLTVEEVRVVSADNLLRGSNIRALNNVLNRNNVEIVELQNVLNNNEIIKDALNQNNVAVTDVIAINVLSGGDVVVFTR
ncbi:MAG: hypothetical protein KME06_20400 [Kastovskya adunca ATA6-11-RM4]|jgi:hypothetical protein|nr:hypothetical protein [Kastovskya adunca ATA6-11-RM4]